MMLYHPSGWSYRKISRKLRQDEQLFFFAENFLLFVSQRCQVKHCLLMYSVETRNNRKTRKTKAKCKDKWLTCNANWLSVLFGNFLDLIHLQKRKHYSLIPFTFAFLLRFFLVLLLLLLLFTFTFALFAWKQ